MRKINKKLISLALVAAMTGVIAGCGKSDQTSGNSSSMYTMKDGDRPRRERRPPRRRRQMAKFLPACI